MSRYRDQQSAQSDRQADSPDGQADWLGTQTTGLYSQKYNPGGQADTVDSHAA